MPDEVYVLFQFIHLYSIVDLNIQCHYRGAGILQVV